MHVSCGRPIPRRKDLRLSLSTTYSGDDEPAYSPSLTASRLRLLAVVFRLTKFVHSGSDLVTNLHIYHVTTSTFGEVEIETAENMTGMKDLYLVHLSPLLDQEFSHGAAALGRTTQALQFVARLRQPFGALLFEAFSRVEYRRVRGWFDHGPSSRGLGSSFDRLDGQHPYDRSTVI